MLCMTSSCAVWCVVSMYVCTAPCVFYVFIYAGFVCYMRLRVCVFELFKHVQQIIQVFEYPVKIKCSMRFKCSHKHTRMPRRHGTEWLKLKWLRPCRSFVVVVVVFLCLSNHFALFSYSIRPKVNLQTSPVLVSILHHVQNSVILPSKRLFYIVSWKNQQWSISPGFAVFLAPRSVKWRSFPNTREDTHTSLLDLHLKLIFYLMEQFGSENVILLDYFKCASEDRPVQLSIFSLCLQIPHIRSLSIIQKGYLIFIPKWKLLYNVVWNKKWKMGARDKEEGWD